MAFDTNAIQRWIPHSARLQRSPALEKVCMSVTHLARAKIEITACSWCGAVLPENEPAAPHPCLGLEYELLEDVVGQPCRQGVPDKLFDTHARTIQVKSTGLPINKLTVRSAEDTNYLARRPRPQLVI